MRSPDYPIEGTSEKYPQGRTTYRRNIGSNIPPRTFKVVVIGDMSVGKTCLICRLCGGKFPEHTETTIGVDFLERTMEVEGEGIKVGYT